MKVDYESYKFHIINPRVITKKIKQGNVDNIPIYTSSGDKCNHKKHPFQKKVGHKGKETLPKKMGQIETKQ